MTRINLSFTAEEIRQLMTGEEMSLMDFTRF